MDPRERARLLAERVAVGGDELRPVGRGTAHLVFAVGPYIVRLVADSEETTARAVQQEATLLARLQTRLPVSVPEPVIVAEDLGGIVYRSLPGRPLLDAQPADTSRLVEDVGSLLLAMGEIDRSELGEVPPDPYPLELWRDEVVEEMVPHLAALTPQERDVVRDLARDPVPEAPTVAVFCHNDLGAEHLLVDESSGQLTGVLDWSDAAMTDPCRDLGRLLRDLGSAAADRIANLCGLPPLLLDRRRIRFHAVIAALEDLSYGFATEDLRYVDASRRALPRLAPLP